MPNKKNTQHYFYNVMRKTIIQFLDLFNDITIARYNQETGNIIKYINVPLKFAPKTKQWYWKELCENEDRRDTVLPMMAIDLSNVEFARDRQVNKNFKVSSRNEGNIKQYFNPVPYDFVFNLKIAAEYMVDITQIVEQIFPFFTPEAYIRISIPELNIKNANGPKDVSGSDYLELRVVYDSASKEETVEIPEADFRVTIWTLGFRVQGYLFSPLFETPRIHNVIQNYYLSDNAIENRSNDVIIGEQDTQSLQTMISATNIPDDDVPIDDSIKKLFKYEHII